MGLERWILQLGTTFTFPAARRWLMQALPHSRNPEGDKDKRQERAQGMRISTLRRPGVRMIAGCSRRACRM